MMKPSELKIDVDVNSKVLVAKLNTISKHTAALAEELEQIDKDVCPNCGIQLDVEESYCDGILAFTTKECKPCGYKYVGR